MSAIVCGKRSFFEDLQSPSPTSSSPPAAKRIRYFSSTSPVRFSPSQVPNLINQLRAAFPDMDSQVFSRFTYLFSCRNWVLIFFFFNWVLLIFHVWNFVSGFSGDVLIWDCILWIPVASSMFKVKFFEV